MTTQLSPEASNEVAGLLLKVAHQFRTYEVNHLKKVRTIPASCGPTDARIINNSNDDAIQKAVTNRQMAEEVEAFLTKMGFEVTTTLLTEVGEKIDG